MNARYLEYRKITQTLMTSGHAPLDRSPALDSPFLAPEHVATDEEMQVRRAYIKALLDELELPDTP